MSRITHLLTDTISYRLRTGVTIYGDPEFLEITTSTAACRVERSKTWQGNTSGDEFVINTKVFLEVDVPVGSRVWLPGASTSSVSNSLPVLAQTKVSFPGGGDLYEIVV